MANEGDARVRHAADGESEAEEDGALPRFTLARVWPRRPLNRGAKRQGKHFPRIWQ